MPIMHRKEPPKTAHEPLQNSLQTAETQMLLSKILESFVFKLGALKEEIPALIAAARDERAAREARLAWMKDADASVDGEAPLYLSSVRFESRSRVMKSKV